jgi:hypothetical protein
MTRPSQQDWAALFALAEVGISERPWAWRADAVAELRGWEREEFEAAVAHCSAYLKELGVFE